MKKGMIQGAVLGAAVTALALGMTFTASAGRSIQVDDGQIGIRINKANCPILNTKGVEVTPFVYEGTTYVPLRSFCESLGLDVEYDEDTNTAVITQKNVSTNYISEQEAKQAAFDAAGVSEKDIEDLECELEWRRGCAVYDIEFEAGGTEYEYQIDALTGKVVEASKQMGPGNMHGQGNKNGQGSTNAACISAQAARDKALEHAGVQLADASQLKCEFDRDDCVYEIEFRAGNTEYEYEIDAKTGAVVKSEKEAAD